MREHSPSDREQRCAEALLYVFGTRLLSCATRAGSVRPVGASISAFSRTASRRLEPSHVVGCAWRILSHAVKWSAATYGIYLFFYSTSLPAVARCAGRACSSRRMEARHSHSK